MMKLYKYRPLSEFLFKELFYQELYFASYKELNDPLDLSARIEFTVVKEEQIEYLIWFLFKTTISLSINNLPYIESNNDKKLIDFNNNDEQRQTFRKRIHEKLVQLKIKQGFIWLDSIETVLADCAREVNLNFEFNFTEFKNELHRLTQKFLENSYATCFSATNNDFLMWSHYASKHSGICIEFNIEHSGLFPYVRKGHRKTDQENYLQRISKWEVSETIYWDRVREVSYQDEQPFINFFDFSPVFDNEHDCDLTGLSKDWTHGFAHELEMVFSTKTNPWKYENEWRAIEINFREPKNPEERIRHYPIEVISSIYFGIRTPEDVKKRISDIFQRLKKGITLYDCKPTKGRELNFELWENYD